MTTTNRLAFGFAALAALAGFSAGLPGAVAPGYGDVIASRTPASHTGAPDALEPRERPEFASAAPYIAHGDAGSNLSIERAATSWATDETSFETGLTAEAELRRRALTYPVHGVNPHELLDTFHDPRGRDRLHQAVDILAPRLAPVVAVEDGVIARLFTNRGAGLSIYQFDRTGRFVYFYAHLERYADGLHDGDPVRGGQVIGYVGTSGNAPEDTPHLHFAIFVLADQQQRWWEGTPINPFAVLR
jgi:murein DD-endopeptidase MepM/ murein hydrolase activator NlpD